MNIRYVPCVKGTLLLIVELFFVFSCSLCAPLADYHQHDGHHSHPQHNTKAATPNKTGHHPFHPFLHPLKDKGCYYILKHYQNLEKIETKEPCLNCTCINSTLMCYLQVCPYTKPPDKDCIVEKEKGDCCPKVWCPEGLLPTTLSDTEELPEDGELSNSSDSLP